MEETRVVQLGSLSLSYLKNAEEYAQKYSEDIIPGTYQGGFTLWECTSDLMRFIESVDFTGKSVLEIGCGHGLVGILALLKGAQAVCFSDFNKQVLEKLTKKNIVSNTDQQTLSRCSFLYGDWQDMQPLDGVAGLEQEGFDYILGSEVIYACENYKKVLNVVDRYLKKDGVGILANKVCYFGVGGSVPEFKEEIEKRGMKWETLQKIVPESGNKKEIISVRK